MKTLETTRQVCRCSLAIEVEEPAMFSDEIMKQLAVCDSCFDSHDERERQRIAKYHKAIERECQDDLRETNVRYPYRD